ncbi:winged helix-turn-helix domain-containing protein [Candidatus Woesearchaeota archaeon]|jgi:DNA-binding Lrp family transcriptional regulator|nr:winged helix-turn-helix domain-containing protein [Candidatus Woesearchaeota archaeon]MBT6518949.1 winged helix-turn-helix domain-containing protein [Candidatus Woesearchaeota archaeon]MBT7368314.1 winged helix-turn-helix domain-containing protein [Candidatus Woesearchaeota archaeon]
MKRKTLDVQNEILKVIKANPDITLSALERKIGTNPTSLKEHCEQLEFLGIIKIERTNKTTKLKIK